MGLYWEGWTALRSGWAPCVVGAHRASSVAPVRVEATMTRLTGSGLAPERTAFVTSVPGFFDRTVAISCSSFFRGRCLRSSMDRARIAPAKQTGLAAWQPGLPVGRDSRRTRKGVSGSQRTLCREGGSGRVPGEIRPGPDVGPLCKAVVPKGRHRCDRGDVRASVRGVRAWPDHPPSATRDLSKRRSDGGSTRRRTPTSAVPSRLSGVRQLLGRQTSALDRVPVIHLQPRPCVRSRRSPRSPVGWEYAALDGE